MLLFVETSSFSTTDYVIFALYCLLIISLGLFVSRDKEGVEKNSSDYFLASKSLPWWAIGASLIASNISAEQIVGMTGSGFTVGLAIATYEWMAAATLLVVGIFFLPIFLEKQIYTMPQFLTQRFGPKVRNIMAVFWILVYVFINLAAVLHLGALSMENVLGLHYYWGVAALCTFAMVYSIYGGLKAVALTDVVQVVFLVAGGMITTYLALELVGYGDVFQGLISLQEKASTHFHMILNPGDIKYEALETVKATGANVSADGVSDTFQKIAEKDGWELLPGLAVIIGGMWITNVNYWGFNQYITQRALAAKNLEEARQGIVFAGFLKLLVPLIVVLPGIAVYILTKKEGYDAETILANNPGGQWIVDTVESLRASMSTPIKNPVPGSAGVWDRPDNAYPSLLSLLPTGLKGLAFAALAAAIVSSLASMVNSTSTIFTMDLYKNYINKNASETSLVTTGRIVAFIAFILAAFTTPVLRDLDQAFQFIQDFTGMISPAVVAVFLLGIFWKPTTTNGVLAGIFIAFPLGLLFDNIEVLKMPFLNRMGWVFLIIMAIIIIVSLIDKKNYDPEKAIDVDPKWFKASTSFWIGATLIIAILTILYTAYW